MSYKPPNSLLIPLLSGLCTWDSEVIGIILDPNLNSFNLLLIQLEFRKTGVRKGNKNDKLTKNQEK